MAPMAPVAPSASGGQTALSGRGAAEATLLNLRGPWGTALRTVDLGVADGTTDDAGRVSAIQKFGIHELSPAVLRDLIDRARSLA